MHFHLTHPKIGRNQLTIETTYLWTDKHEYQWEANKVGWQKPVALTSCIPLNGQF